MAQCCHILPRGSAASTTVGSNLCTTPPGTPPALQDRTLDCIPALTTPPTELFIRQFIETCIKQARNQAPIGPRGKSDRPFKFRKPDLYYRGSHMECYYFCQQCEDYFKTAGAQEQKRVPFATGFLKDHILNCWQHHMTWTQRNRLVHPYQGQIEEVFKEESKKIRCICWPHLEQDEKSLLI